KKNDVPFSTSADISKLKAGNYLLQVTDRNGCMRAWKYKLVQPSLLNAQLFAVAPTCLGRSNGMVGIKAVSGGVYPYKFEWNTLTQQSEDTVTGLPGGTYSVNITDSLNCRITRSITMKEPPGLEVTLAFDTLYHGRHVSCHSANDARIKANVKGGTIPYSYQWLNLSNDNLSYPNIPVLQGVNVGKYKVKVTDKFNCIAESSPIEVIQPDSLQVEIVPAHLRCYNDYSGSALARVKGGTPPYRYFWSGLEMDSVIYSLLAGIYNLTVKDINGCSVSASVNIIQPDSLKVQVKGIRQPYCPATFDGEISLSAEGGTRPYNFSWNNGLSGSLIKNIKEGVYIYTLTDSEGCLVTDTIELTSTMPDCIDIPKAFSPNGDGINDTWNILVGDPSNPLPLSVAYPNARIEVYNRWGVLVYRSEKGYTREWDGRSKYKELPPDSYYYSIDLGIGKKKLIGIVSIVK
ncbi:MAG: gliding motility-associated C-terminal domain-containing protein, partial [Bacteroidales bacterium]|nr:gliding motility-associated C-terminal domain-containing protein [Bacteroidales bacterium]